MNLRVDVISDVICPWCYIGKRRLEKAIAELGMPVEVRWHPFQLNPAMPKEGLSRREYRTRKFGSWERSQELDARVIAVGKEEGIDFAFDRIERTPNTLDAHRLIWLAGRGGVQDAVVEALFRAYFTEGRNIGDNETLLDVIVDVGLERSAAEAVLGGDDGMEAVKEGEKLSKQHHVDSVPFFVVNGMFTLAGAQLPEEFLRLFRESFGPKV
ncbi:MAG: DsbA family oxidoreductase [Planctomycetaceae bacterium]